MERFEINVSSPTYFDGLEGAEIVFHAINKSGSLAMESVIREGFVASGRYGEMMSHYKRAGLIEDFYDMVNKKRSRFVVAHYLYGELAPRDQRVWVTQFRHPLPKLLSSYNWMKLKHEDIGADIPNLIDFTVKSKGIMHSLVSQFGTLRWQKYRKRWRMEREPTADSLYYASIEALENDVHTISLAERFEESVFLYARLCELPSLIPWVRDNRNPGRTLADEITDEEREVIEDVFRYDYMLYDYAVDRFEQQLREIDFGDNLDEYKQACADQYKDRILIPAHSYQRRVKTDTFQSGLRRLVNSPAKVGGYIPGYRGSG